MNAQEWERAMRKLDPDFEGSIWQKMGYSPELCPSCGAHIRKGICLNACHLGDAGKLSFNLRIGTQTIVPEAGHAMTQKALLQGLAQMFAEVVNLHEYSDVGDSG